MSIVFKTKGGSMIVLANVTNHWSEAKLECYQKPIKVYNIHRNFILNYNF